LEAEPDCFSKRRRPLPRWEVESELSLGVSPWFSIEQSGGSEVGSRPTASAKCCEVETEGIQRNAVDDIAGERPDALFVAGDPFFNSRQVFTPVAS